MDLLRTYVPQPNELDVDLVLEARQVLETHLRSIFAELDTRPNSVLGDLVLIPDSIFFGVMEEVTRRFTSDLDLGRVARGIVYNEDFVRTYLRNYGVDASDAVNASGLVMLTFNENKNYVFDAGSVFNFSDSKFTVNEDEGNPVIIYATGTANVKRVLTKIGPGQFSVLLPVNGTPGANVSDGTKATHNLTHEELLSVNAAGDFDPGAQPETIPQMAIKAMRTFASATLTSRSGAVSFIQKNWPRTVGVSVTLTGDREMIRDGQNILGVSTGAMDVYLRSKSRYSFGQSVLSLTYDTEERCFVGLLDLPVTPAFFAPNTGIFQVNNFGNSRGVNDIYATSNDKLIDSPGVAYSKKETLGIKIADTNPTDYEPAVNGVVKTVTGDSFLTYAGEYAGGVFHSARSRKVTIRIDATATVDGLAGLRANVVDSLSGETAVIYFVPNDSSSPTAADIRRTDVGYKRMFQGLSVQLRPAGGGALTVADLVGHSYQFEFKGKTASFSVSYLYDPSLIQVDNVVQNPDNRPVGASVLVKSFNICHVTDFVVNYTLDAGTTLDVESARAEIFAYINNLSYPDVYEETQIGRILQRYGAKTLRSVSKRGTFYPSLATVFVKQDGTEEEIPRMVTETLLPTVNDAGLGARNISYILYSEVIKFNAVST